MAQKVDVLEPKLLAVTNQLLDLGKRNRLLNYKDTGLKSLKLLNKNTEEVFRAVKGYRELEFFDVDQSLLDYHNSLDDNTRLSDDPLKYEFDFVYEIVRKQIQGKELIAYKNGYQVQRVLKSLAKDHRTSLIEKGINPLYISFGFITYTEEGESYVAPLLLIPVELSNETGAYILRQYEDDILLNPTLKFYLSEAYHIELPEYDDEAYSTYLDKLRQSLEGHDNVTFNDGASLGIYSFYKMNMYNDLIAHKDLVLKNENIRRLLGENNYIKAEYEKEQTYPVVNCDSSQLEAIQKAANGESFTLQGPPGSGKSQTITNMIATLLGAGKKILFVSEKIAALNVVYENLRRAKLSEFALELHSNKANKKEFIEKLYKAATLPRYEMNLKTRFLESKYQNLRSRLSNYEKELHEIIPGLDATLLDLYQIYLSIDVEPLKIKLDIEDYNLYNLDKIILLFNEYVVYSGSLGRDYRKSGLHGLNLSGVDNILNIKNDLEVSIKHLYRLIEIKYILDTSTLSVKSDTVIEIYNAMSIIEKLNRIKTFCPFYFIKKARLRIIDLVDKYISILKNFDSSVMNNYYDEVLNDKLEPIYNELKNAKGMFKSFNSNYKNALNSILSRRKSKATVEMLLEEIPKIIDYKRYMGIIDSYKADMLKFQINADTMDLKQVLADCHMLENIPDLLIDQEKFKTIKSELKEVPAFQYFKSDSLNLMNVSKLFYKKDIDIYNADINVVLDRVTQIYNECDFIYNYSELSKIVDEIKDYKALDFLNMFLDTDRDINEISDSYKKTFVKQKIDEIHGESERLSNFKSMSVDDIINEFRDLDERILAINRDYIISKNSYKRQDNLVEGSQFKLLDKEYNKQRRQLPIRSLLEKTFELALDVKPVFLMSPLSVSTYLASELNMFDCVIFDEASQIFACDAFGSIYRAKQCIVIGDTKQMPPTSFFQASAETLNQTDDEPVEEEYDLESILDKASNTFETSSLKWHYRSRSEELIVFSNQAFYDSNLITIPQSHQHEQGFGIDFYYVKEGRYDQSTRTNPIEAQKVCDMVFEHFDNSMLSLGVVAFSNVQAELITSLIEKQLKKNPKYEKFFDDTLDEPFFVKNLESVQGDERDRIIFSICYGYNNENKFHQRFGPLNASGGERRLNVAITRAKYNISIVSSIRYSDIRENKESQGVTLLRKYLQFAENIIVEKNYDESQSVTIKSITEYIESLGYKVVNNYGTSSFKVDLAVKKDDDFILAIMIDGKNSYSTNLTDNYRLERMLLERQGWRYYKLFTTAWINNAEVEKERIKQALEGTLVEGEEYERVSGDVSFLKVEGNDDAIDFDFTTYDYLDTNVGKKAYDSEGMERLLAEIIKVESPIHRDYIEKRVAKILGYEKVDKKLKAEIEEAMPKRVLKLGDFLFNFRVSDIKLRLESDREIPEIYTDELADGIHTIVERNNGISIAGCYKTLVNMLGYDKVTAQSKKELDKALEHLKLDRKIEERKECLYLLK